MSLQSQSADIISCPHYRLWREDNVVFIYSKGTWGQSTAGSFCGDYKSICHLVIGRKWALVSHAKNWIVSTPEIEPLLVGLSRAEDNHGLAASARIVSDSALAQFQLKHISEKIPDYYPARDFSDETAAVTWLWEQGFHPATQSFSGLAGNVEFNYDN